MTSNNFAAVSPIKDVFRSRSNLIGRYRTNEHLGCRLNVANGTITPMAAIKPRHRISPKVENRKDNSFVKTALSVLNEEPIQPYFPCEQKVGLSFLPHQSGQVSMRKNTNFNIMVLGQKYSGKTTFVHMLFGKDFQDTATETPGGYFNIRSLNSQNGTLSVVECTEGAFDNEMVRGLEAIKYIEDGYRLHVFRSEAVYRQNNYDNRVHCCIYFLDLRSGDLTNYDLYLIKKLSRIVNLIPVVGKSDTLTTSDILQFKILVQKKFEEESITLCPFLGGEQKNFIMRNVPFSIICSTNYYRNKENKLVRGRKYHWGIAEVDDSSHCDFHFVEKILFEENMVDLIMSTESYYEKYRETLMNIRYSAALKNNALANLDESGFSQLLTYHKTNYNETERMLIQENEIYIYKLKMLEEEYIKRINNQEDHFRLWKRKLIEKQREYNEDINKNYTIYLELKCELLALRKNIPSLSKSNALNTLNEISLSELNILNSS